MIDSDKREFMSVMMTTADLYDKTINPERIAVYWNALKHRELSDIKAAINFHIQDPQRGRFFPLPADVSAQLPAERDPWPDAEVAWARCPKDEGESGALCEEVAAALDVASGFIYEGDMVAARMAFKAEYTRRVADAKIMGAIPKWWPSYGHDKDGRNIADVEVVKMQNLALPLTEQKPIPMIEHQETIALEHLIGMAAKNTNSDPKIARAALDEMLGRKRDEV